MMIYSNIYTVGFENIEKNISNYNRNDLEKVIRWLNSYLNK